ncbi:tat pathway signal sequence [Colletotrichum limetticola]|uniref:Tat pathway signal sequence n=1 Tax=Colletotrichum limetticola TaxID=1209924 RepID=A0ABQ9PJA2_9PEZI|nr:tat pathway signal sequence [Colletotrichum limetticola]
MLAASRFTRRVMTSAYANGSAKAAYSTSSATTTALSRWSIATAQLPAVDKIKALHIYDFDNTLFKTPLPNPALWSGPTIGVLSSQDVICNGGWWHDSRILSATGEGADTEEKRAWEGWWNEKIVELVKLSVKQKDALCVLLTGRSERGFGELIKRMIHSKGLEFDMVGLKPAVSPTNQNFSSTMHFKQLFLTAVMETYKNAEEIRIYEDRPKHVKGFRDFMTEYNRKQNINATRTRGPITAEVVQVADMSTTLDPVVEVAEVQHMINLHNEEIGKHSSDVRPQRLRIKKTVYFTGYLISKEDTAQLMKMAQIPSGLPEQELKFHANNILICPRPCPASILEKVGGMGSKMKWEVTGTACFENSIWAASLRPVPATAKFHTDNPSPLVVLALRKGARPVDAGKIQNWQPIPADKAMTFETTVGEKMILRIEPEDPREDEYESLFANKSSKRKHDGGDYSRDHHRHNPYNGRTERRDFHSGRGGGGRGGGGGGGFRGGGGRGGRGRGNGKGGRGGRGMHGYRSLDDVEPRNQQGGYGQTVEYDDNSYPSLPGQQQGGFQGGQQQQYQPPLSAWNSGPPPNAPTGPAGRPMGGGGGGGNYGGGGNAGNSNDLQSYY